MHPVHEGIDSGDEVAAGGRVEQSRVIAYA
jgi:hypothetical protein